MAKQSPPDGLSPDFPKMSRPARAALEVAGFTELEQLNGVSRKKILGLHGMGPKAFRELEQALAQRGWSFSEP